MTRVRLAKLVDGSTPIARCARDYGLGARHSRLLVAAMMKCGGTYLSAVLGSLPGLREESLVFAHGRREQELSVAKIFSLRGSFCAHHHVRNSTSTERILKLYGIFPIVLVRDVFDVVVSMRDYIAAGHITNQIAYVPPLMSLWGGGNPVDPSDAAARLRTVDTSTRLVAQNRSREDVERFLVDMFVPWYFHFYLSWLDRPDLILVTYEQLIEDPMATVLRIVTRAGVDASDAEIAGAIAAAGKVDTRLNKGVVGRGCVLAPRLKERVCQMARYYEGVDFSPMGLV